jgi:galactose-6-phosphate isomerase
MPPLLDVSEILSDPDFVDTALACIRNTQTVGPDGIAVNAKVTTPFSGVVTNDDGDIMLRQADGTFVKGSIMVHTRFVLTNGVAGIDADIVVWRGRKFTVVNVADYSTYGAGFVAASCEPLSLSGS